MSGELEERDGRRKETACCDSCIGSRSDCEEKPLTCLNDCEMLNDMFFFCIVPECRSHFYA